MNSLRNIVDRIKVPTWIVVLVWIYALWRTFKSGVLQEAFGAAKEYVRPIKF